MTKHNICNLRLLETEGRKPQDVRRSLMTGCVLGENDKDVAKKVNQQQKENSHQKN